jgi:hypothetical protein
VQRAWRARSIREENKKRRREERETLVLTQNKTKGELHRLFVVLRHQDTEDMHSCKNEIGKKDFFN